ncbi:type II secretion system protein GspG [Myxococcaceae bacterium GXIMD 01537]
MSEHVSPQSPAGADRPSRVGRVVLAGIILSSTALAFGLVYLTEDTTLSPRQREARTEIRRLQTFFQAHHRILGRFPTEQEGFAPLIEAKLLASVPDDPWGRPYVYRYDGKKSNVMSFGADGQPGGSGEDADLTGGGVVAEVRP